MFESFLSVWRKDLHDTAIWKFDTSWNRYWILYRDMMKIKRWSKKETMKNKVKKHYKHYWIILQYSLNLRHIKSDIESSKEKWKSPKPSGPMFFRCSWGSLTIVCDYFWWSPIIGPLMRCLQCIAQVLLITTKSSFSLYTNDVFEILFSILSNNIHPHRLIVVGTILYVGVCNDKQSSN